MYVVEESENLRRRKIFSIALLVAGICLSQFFLLQFDLAYGFSFDELVVHFPFPFFSIRNHAQEEIKITTAIIGYVCFLVFLLLNYKRAKERNHLPSTIGIIICVYALLHEVNTFVMACRQEFTRDPVLAGWVILLLCLGSWRFSFGDA